MELVVYKTDDGQFVGVSKEDYVNNKLYKKGKFVEEIKLASFDDLKKYMVLKYGRVDAFVWKDNNIEFLYDVQPDAVIKAVFEVPIWKFGNKFAIPVCGKKFLAFEMRIPVMRDDGSFDIEDVESFTDVDDEIIFGMLVEALKQNRFAELDKIIEVKGNE